jgi:hypothetical protein
VEHPDAGNNPRRVYAYWRLVRTLIATGCVAAYLIVAMTALIIADIEDPVRQGIVRHLILLSVIGASLLVISEPVADRRIDNALRREGQDTLNPHNGGHWPEKQEIDDDGVRSDDRY